MLRTAPAQTSWPLSLRLRVAASLVLLDRFPETAARLPVWDDLGRDGQQVANRSRWSEPMGLAFLSRWHDQLVPPEVERWRVLFDRIGSLAISLTSNRLGRRFIDLRTERASSQAEQRQLAGAGNALAVVNVGPGSRVLNQLSVATAVDACLDGGSSSALPWNLPGVDPAALVDLPALFGCDDPVTVATAAEARLVVEAWGAGAKGIVTVREPGYAALRVCNAVNEDGTARFYDYGRATRVSVFGSLKPDIDPEEAADSFLQRADPRAAFPGLRLWRTADLQAAQGVESDFFAVPAARRRDVIERALVGHVPAPHLSMAVDRVVERIESRSEVGDVRWLLRQVQIGACTLFPNELADLVNGASSPAEALTASDEALIELAANGLVRTRGDMIEIVVRDTPRFRGLVQNFPGSLLRVGRVDGLHPGHMEVVLGRYARQRLLDPDRCYRVPNRWRGVLAGSGRETDRVPAGRVPVSDPPLPRRLSWVDANRASGPGSRKHNCWNVTAAVAHYLSTSEPTISLPRYYTAEGLGLNLVEYLDSLGAGPPVFVTNLAEAEAVVGAWEPWWHGVVAASFNSFSTHMFNVITAGRTVRFLDGYDGVPGESQFDKTWERIGIASLGPVDYRLTASIDEVEGFSSTA